MSYDMPRLEFGWSDGGLCVVCDVMMQLQELLIDEEAEATRRALDKAKKEKEVKDRLDMIRHNTEQASTH